MCWSVAALFTIWSRASRLKLTVMTSTIGRIPPSAAPIPAPTNADSDKGRIAHAVGTELFEQALTHGEAAAVATDVLPHEEHALVTQKRVTQRVVHRLAVCRPHGSLGRGHDAESL